VYILIHLTDIFLDKVTMLRTGRSVVGIPVVATDLQNVHTCLGAHTTPFSIVTEFLYRG